MTGPISRLPDAAYVTIVIYLVLICRVVACQKLHYISHNKRHITMKFPGDLTKFQ